MPYLYIKVDEKLYLKDPDGSDLGKKIVSRSINLIDEVGFEAFTFKKLAKHIGSTETSIYRYFENKHQLLIYLLNWYWKWRLFQVQFNVNNIEDPELKLKIALKVLAEPIKLDSNFMHVDEVALDRIVVAESSKAYLTKKVDKEHRQGYFSAYKDLCHHLASVIKEVNPYYKFPVSLASTLFETILEQKYFAEHMPSITELEAENYQENLFEFIEELAFNTLNNKCIYQLAK
jgi:AcrR family transcriptional regulator